MSFDLSPWVGIFSAIWLAFFISGRWQFNRVKQLTLDMILDQARQQRREHQNLSVEDLYQQVLPIWEEMLRKNAWFILHKTELFPIPASPAILKTRLNFTPAWMGAFLRVNGVRLPAAEQLEEEIDHITSLVPKNRKKG